MFKKVLAGALACATLFACVSCSSKTPPAPSSSGSTPPASTSSAGSGSDVFTNGPEEVLTLVHGNNLGTPNDKWANYFKELVEERSEGKITVNVYPNNEMGTERELTEGVQVGTYDIQVTGLISSLSFIPALATLNMPFMFNGMTAAQIDQALNQSDYHTLMQNAYGDSQFYLLGGFMQAATFRNVTSNRAINTLEDFKGLKIRIVENAYCLKFWESIGSAPTSVTWAETYLALQQGMVDAQENPFDNIYLGNIQDVQKYLVISEHLLNVNHMIMNKARFDSLPQRYQQVVEECAAQAREKAADEMAQSIEEYHQKLLDAGMTEIVLDDAVITQLKEQSEGVYDMIRSELGEEYYTTLADAVDKAKK